MSNFVGGQKVFLWVDVWGVNLSFFGGTNKCHPLFICPKLLVRAFFLWKKSRKKRNSLKKFVAEKEKICVKVFFFLLNCLKACQMTKMNSFMYVKIAFYSNITTYPFYRKFSIDISGEQNKTTTLTHILEKSLNL